MFKQSSGYNPNLFRPKLTIAQQPWRKITRLSSGEIIVPAIVWGGTGGFGWGVVRYLTTGQWFVWEIIFLGLLAIIICAGGIYLFKVWHSR